MKKGMVIFLLILLAGCAAPPQKAMINGSCGRFKGASFGEWVNITLPEGTDGPKLTFEIYKQVQALSPGYFIYEFCDRKCEAENARPSLDSIRYFECDAKNWKIRCAYDYEGWLCMNVTR